MAYSTTLLLIQETNVNFCPILKCIVTYLFRKESSLLLLWNADANLTTYTQTSSNYLTPDKLLTNALARCKPGRQELYIIDLSHLQSSTSHNAMQQISHIVKKKFIFICRSRYPHFFEIFYCSLIVVISQDFSNVPIASHPVHIVSISALRTVRTGYLRNYAAGNK